MWRGQKLRRVLSRGTARRPRGGPLALALAPVVLLAAGCGGGARQDAGEQAHTYSLRVVRTLFPTKQSIARPTLLILEVKNTGTQTAPHVAVTVDSLNYVAHYPELASRQRPVWAIERGPGRVANPPVQTQEVSQLGGAQTAYVNTWSLGPLAAGATQTYRWKLMPLKSGRHVIHYTVVPGIAGKAQASLVAGAGSLRGRFAANIAGAPPSTHVNPNTGQVVAGPFPPTP